MKINEDVAALLVVFLILALALGLPFLIGSTFNQKCKRAYPDNPAAVERCVERAGDGGPVYEENIGSKEFSK